MPPFLLPVILSKVRSPYFHDKRLKFMLLKNEICKKKSFRIIFLTTNGDSYLTKHKLTVCNFRTFSKNRSHLTSQIWLKFGTKADFRVITTKWLLKSSNCSYIMEVSVGFGQRQICLSDIIAMG